MSLVDEIRSQPGVIRDVLEQPLAVEIPKPGWAHIAARGTSDNAARYAT